MGIPNFSVERMAAGGTVLLIRPSFVCRHRSPPRYHHMRLITCLLLCVIHLGASAGQSSTNRLEVRLSISAVNHGRPVVTVERGQSDAYGSRFEFDSQMIRGWRTNYSVCSAALVQAAEKEHLNSAALGTILHRLFTAPANTNLAILPIGASLVTNRTNLTLFPVTYPSTLKEGELVWVVGLKWELARMVAEDATLGHIRVFAISQETLKQVGFVTCK